MSDLPVVVSFATPKYESYMGRLRRSLAALGCDSYTEVREDRGSWERNCNQKPEFIFEQLAARRKPIIWLDADAELMAVPELFRDAQFDFAVCNRKDLGFGSGTLYFSPRALHLVALWRELALRKPKLWDQRLLESAWHSLVECKLEPTTQWLPISYLTKIDNPEGAVVLHHQASRTHK